MTQYIVKVGTTGQGARPGCEDAAGFDYWGPMSRRETETFVKQVKETWEERAKQDPHGFVYGEVVVESIPLRPTPEGGLPSQAEKAASNWHLTRDERMQLLGR